MRRVIITPKPRKPPVKIKAKSFPAERHRIIIQHDLIPPKRSRFFRIEWQRRRNPIPRRLAGESCEKEGEARSPNETRKRFIWGYMPLALRNANPRHCERSEANQENLQVTPGLQRP